MVASDSEDDEPLSLRAQRVKHPAPAVTTDTRRPSRNSSAGNDEGKAPLHSRSRGFGSEHPSPSESEAYPDSSCISRASTVPINDDDEMPERGQPVGDDDANMLLLSPEMVAVWAADLDLSPLVLPTAGSTAAPPALALPRRQDGALGLDDAADLVAAQHREWRDRLRAALKDPDAAAMSSATTVLVHTAINQDDPCVTIRVLCGMTEAQVWSLEAPARELVSSLRVRVLARQQSLGLLPAAQQGGFRLGHGLL